MRWLTVLLTIGIAYGQGLPAQLAGTPEVPCPEPDTTVTCFELDGTLPEVEARIDTNMLDLGLEPAGWFDTLAELMDPLEVSGEETEGVRYTGVATDEAWLLIIASVEYGVMIVDLQLAMETQP